MKPEYVYRAEILGWTDGDTCRVRVDLGFKIFRIESVRVYGINAPELSSQDAGERELAKVSRAAAGVMAPEGRTVTIRSHKGGADKYGRYLAEIFIDDGREVGAEMVKAGYAKAWDGTGPRP